MTETGKDLFLGIDPGFTGAIAIVGGKEPFLADMPITTNVKGSREVDAEFLFTVLALYAPRIRAAVVEQVGSRPGEGGSSIFKFGFGAGVIRGVLGSLQIKPFYVQPAVWKSLLGVSSDKETSLALARKLYPASTLQLARKKDHGRAEALLLAHFGATRLSHV